MPVSTKVNYQQQSISVHNASEYMTQKVGDRLPASGAGAKLPHGWPRRTSLSRAWLHLLFRQRPLCVAHSTTHLPLLLSSWARMLGTVACHKWLHATTQYLIGKICV